MNPLRTFHGAITRQNPGNQPPGGWYPEQRMTGGRSPQVDDDLGGVCGVSGRRDGSLTQGKYADLVVLDHDIMTIEAERILSTGAEATYAFPAHLG